MIGAERGGRGSAWFVSDAEQQFVLRHYCRGGLPGRVSRDRYVFLGGELTRSFREWHLLAQLRHLDLPVPNPVAARYVRHGLVYTADLITERLMHVESLATLVATDRITSARLEAVGATLRRFHDAGVWHADLNAHNIQLDNERVWLLDFDRGRLLPRPVAGEANLRRLERSLRKVVAAADAHAVAELMAAIRRGYSRPAGASA